MPRSLLPPLPDALSEQNGLATPNDIARSGAQTRAVAVAIEQVVDEHFDGLWRFVRSLGVREADVDDVLQEVVVVLVKRFDDVAPPQRKSFLFGTAVRVASDHRRRAWNRQEERRLDDLPEPVSSASGPDDLLDAARASALLERVLDTLPLGVRAVFVLYEIEEHTMNEIATMLEIPSGTVASRLRRARAHFEAEVARFQGKTQKKHPRKDERGP